jgi:AcrR family transcriptional regulator
MRSRDTRREILNAAQRLIEAEGIMRLTTKEIAREADCAEGTLFKYFKRKEDICLAVVLENAPLFREAIEKLRPGEGTVAKNFENMALAAIDFFEKLMPLTLSLFADATLLARHRREMRKHGRGPEDVFGLIGRYVDSERKLGRIDRHAVPESVAALLLGPCFHRVLIRQVTGKDLSRTSDQKFVSAVVRTLMRGLHGDNA